MSKHKATIALLTLALLLSIGAGILNSRTQSVHAAIARNDASITRLQEGLRAIAAESLSAEQQVQALQTQLNTANSELAALQHTLRDASLRANPNLEQLTALALQRLRDGVQQGTEPPVESPLALVDTSNSLAGQLLVRPYNERMSRVMTESRVGWFLDSLGITDPRRSNIIEALTQASVEGGLTRAMLAEGEISQEEANARGEEFSFSKVLAGLLTEEEGSRLAEFNQQTRITSLSYTAFNSLFRQNRSLEPQLMEHIATRYAEHVQAVETANLPTPEAVLEARIAALSSLRLDLQPTLDAPHREALDALIASELLTLEQRSRGAQ